MKKIGLIHIYTFIAFIFSSSVYAGDTSKELTLQIAENGNTYELSVPASHLIMIITKNYLLPKKSSTGGATNSPRYFLFEAPNNGIIASGWFESSNGYAGFNKYWENEKKSWGSSSASQAPVNEKFFNLNGWEAVSYDKPINNEITSHNLRAHFVKSGTWIDLHISITSENPDLKSDETLMSFIKSIQIKERP